MKKIFIISTALFSGVLLNSLLAEDAAEPLQTKPLIIEDGDKSPLPEVVEFNRHIRPIFSSTCFNCHGPDSHEAKGNVQLHSFAAATANYDRRKRKGREKYAIVPGNLEKSAVWEYINEEDEEYIMPEADFHRRLTRREIALVGKWIEQGAKYEDHWAYKKLPASQNLSENETVKKIDLLVQSELTKQSLSSLGQAEKRTLIRRLSFDLRGLPPTPAELKAFLADTSPDAWQKLVQTFLADKAYGERMAVHWLDLVRFSDSAGFHGDQNQHTWAYRDYVIKAFNDNMKYDQFTREQLAGDKLPKPTQAQLVATAYNRLNMVTKEGGAQPGEYLAKYAADRVRNVSAVWMGSTIGCAECHDHKYDPFTAKDFYRMSAFFADVKELGVYNIDFDGKAVGNNDYFPPMLALPNKDQATKLDQLKLQIAKFHKAPTGLKQANWKTLDVNKVKSEQGASFKKLQDGSWLAQGKNPKSDTYHVRFKMPAGQRALRMDILRHESFKGLSRGNGNFVLTHVSLKQISKGKSKNLRIARSAADYEQSGYSASALIAGAHRSYGWAVGGHQIQDKDRQLCLQLPSKIAVKADDEFELELRFNSPYPKHQFARFKLSSSKELGQVLSKAGSLSSLNNNLKKLKGKLPRVLVTESVKPRMTRVLPRGNWKSEEGEIVQPGVPHFMQQINKKARADRLDLANWLCSEDNPLAARTFVNRIWALHFGSGLSSICEDFGSQGAMPENEALLNLLARYFVDSGWDVKALHRVILQSKAYQRKSDAVKNILSIDPQNRYLARQSQRRIAAEFIRDQALSVSGLLQDSKGGRSVYPYQPKGYYASLNHPRRTYPTSRGGDLYRRGVYTHWQRTFLHPFLKSFDAPSREDAICVRSISNTPLQALSLLNEPAMLEAAAHFALKWQKLDTAKKSSLPAAFESFFSRMPTAQENELIQQFYQRELLRFKDEPSRLQELAKSCRLAKAQAKITAEQGAWISLSRLIFNLHESTTLR